MKPEAITKARDRLHLAQTTLEKIEHCKSYKEFVGLWYTFLVAYKNIYTILNKGAKGSAQSRQWCGAKAQERKDDPLLQYLFQARDDDEHGTDPVTSHVSGRVRIGVRKPGFSKGMRINKIQFDGPGDPPVIDVEGVDGLPVLTVFHPPTARLNRVYGGRGDVPYDPPETHKGQPLADQSPLTIGRLAIAHMSALIDEAEKLA